MTSSLTIDHLGLHEGARLRQIRLRALADAPDAFSSTLAETEQRPPESWSQQVRDIETYVAVLNGHDVGMARGCASTEDPDDAFLISMWVAPEARNKRIGRALVARVIAWAKREGFARLVLDVADDNRAAVALYAAMGFHPTGEVGALPAPRDHIREHRRALVLSD